MNSDLQRLQAYPFQRLRELFKGVVPSVDYAPIDLSIGEPKHPTPQLIKKALINNLGGLSSYPTTQGSLALREAIASWLGRRYSIVTPNADSEVLPVNGSREALFAFAQAVINRKSSGVYVVCPNPFYQIYEGAALLAGAQPYFINTTIENGYQMMFDTVPSKVWQRTQLIYVCSPANPSGQVMDLSAWRSLFELAEQYGFVIAADECYSEIYFNDAMPPLGALEAARHLGRDYQRLVVFGSLSKRSNVPGMRSGFVAGDAQILATFARYRTYHGCAMNPAVQAASVAAWNDEDHVIDNRRLYKEKFKRLIPMLHKVFSFTVPDATFYLWVKSSFADTELALRLYRDYHLTVLPGSFLAREAEGINPGKDFVRLALVASLEECVHAAERILDTLS